MSSAEIYVITHKPYRMPEDPQYIPLQVGAINAEHFLPHTDDTGDHISEKNTCYCELTGLYWIWKNVKVRAVGLVHYRRYLGRRGLHRNAWERILDSARIEELLKATDVILPKPRHYWIETNYTQYAHAHHEKDLLATRDCVEKLYPQYLPDFDALMRKTKGHRLNMMIMKKELFDQYCEWLFTLLFALEKRIDITNYDSYNKRVFGFIGERLLDVWLMYHHTPYIEVPIVYTESVHWIAKGFHLLKRKFSASTTGM